MERKDIKADGTVYVMGRSRWDDNFARVVETERLWEFSNSRHGRENYVKPVTGPMSRGMDRSGWSTTHRYTGLLVIAAPWKYNTAEQDEIVETLRSLDLTPVTGASFEDAEEALKVFRTTLPQHVTAEVVVSRRLKSTWEDHVIQRRADREARDHAEAMEAARKEKSEAANARVRSLLEAHGITGFRTSQDAYVPSRGSVSIDATTLADLLERLTCTDR